VLLHTDARQDESGTETGGAGHHHFAGAAALNPFTEDGRRKSEQHQGDGINPTDLRDGPIARGVVGRTAQESAQGFVENTETVDLANAHVYGDGGRWHQPSRKSRARHSGFAGKKMGRVITHSVGREFVD